MRFCEDVFARGGAILAGAGGDRFVYDLRRRFDLFCKLNPLVWDLYGPTETTIWSTFTQVTAGKVSGSIGRPIANTQVYVLDRQQQLLPVGVPGELYIGGAGLARGYLNRIQLTTEKFVSNRFDEDPQARLYRTGDRCRWHADGTLEFLGRLDNQVKLRGFRIELGEIEAVLHEHPDVAHCVVVLCEDGEKRLVAHCVPAHDRQLDCAQLRHDLQSLLPDYMLPAAFVSLESLPLTPSGKIDRRALVGIVPVPQTAAEFVGPLTPLEEAMAKIWCNLLRVDRVGRDDNFFELGGHSLLAVQLVSRIRDEFDTELSVRSVFESPTLALLAKHLLMQMAADIDSDQW